MSRVTAGAATTPEAGPCAFDADKETWDCWSGAPRGAGDLTVRVELLRIVSDHFRQDISAYWSHATFYTVLQGALATVLATTVGPTDSDAGPALLAPSVLAFLLSVAGLLFATTWLLSALGRRRLIAEWRNQVLHHEGLVEPTHRSYLRVERVARRHPLEPTKVTLLVPCALAIAWGVALVWSAAMVW